MRKQMKSKSIEGLSAVAMVSSIALLLSACDAGSGGVVAGGVAPRSASRAAVFKCASEKLSSLPTPVSSTEKIKVCRRSEDVSGESGAREASDEMAREAKDIEITPRFYAFGKKGRFRILQIVATETKSETNSGARVSGKPETKTETKVDPTLNLENERLVNAFLGEKCGPVVERVFKRASLDTKVIYRSLRDLDRLSDATASKTAGSANALFGDARKAAPPVDDSAKSRAADLGSMDINFILKLKYSASEGLVIRDEVDAVSSGPLMATGDAAEGQHLAFCQQVLMRVSENLGLGTGRDCASREAADTKTAEAQNVKASEKAPEKVSKKSVVGLTKVSMRNPQDLKNLRLADDEVSSIIKPLCGEGKKGVDVKIESE